MHGHLTRLFTTMSADEMDTDPMFMVSGELPREHSHVHTATLQVHCGAEYFEWTAPTSIVLPSGRTSQFEEGAPYYGTDSQYCEDRYENGFYPGASMDQIREVAASRATTLGGGGVTCSARPSSAGLGGLGLLGLLGAALLFRRR